VLAFFGTPIAHEDDPERAILAALRLREAVQQLGLEVTVGINTGEVYLGAVGGGGHQEITAMGTAINLAARLREKAQPGEILVGEATYRQTRSAFQFRRRVAATRTGKQPEIAFAVEGPLPQSEKPRGLEGRLVRGGPLGEGGVAARVHPYESRHGDPPLWTLYLDDTATT
jgi:class 3 adenylate cyclase